MTVRLRAAGLAKTYGETVVLSRVDFEVEAGEIRGLVGENGAGKSTLIKILTGAVMPDAGGVHVDGKSIPLGRPLEIRRLGVSVVYQEFTLVPDLTVGENMFLGREIGRSFLDRTSMRSKAAALLRELGVDVDANARVGSLSVAHQQMVEIARALLTDAKVLILDEPSATLSSSDVDTLHAVLRRLRARGLAIVYVSHRLEELFALTDRLTVLRDGRHVVTAPTETMSRDSLIRYMVGRDVSEEFQPREPRLGRTILSVDRLSSRPRFSDVTFDVKAGEIVGLAGLVGAGRTSTAMAVAGALRSEGRITIDGRVTRPASPHAAIQHGVAYVTEDRKAAGVFPWLSLERNVTVTHQWSFMRGPLLSVRRERDAAAHAVRAFDIRAAGLWQPAGTLSGGNQQKALVARYLVKPPRVLILDEPTRGVDVGARAEIYRAMNRLTDEGLGILMISSDLPEVVGMSDRVVVMREGRTVGELRRPEIQANRVMALATTGAA